MTSTTALGVIIALQPLALLKKHIQVSLVSLDPEPCNPPPPPPPPLSYPLGVIIALQSLALFQKYMQVKSGVLKKLACFSRTPWNGFSQVSLKRRRRKKPLALICKPSLRP